MIAPSPAPRPPKRRRWPWVAIGFLLLLAAVLVFVGSYPSWAGPRVRDELARRASDRMGGPVTVRDLTLDYTRVELSGVAFSEGATSIEFDRIVIDLDPTQVRRGRFESQRVTLMGGRVVGDVRSLRSMAKRALGESQSGDEDEGGGEASWLRRRISARPDEVVIEGVTLDVIHDKRSLSAALHATVDVPEETVDLELRGAKIDLDGRALQASSISTHLRRDGAELSFPLEVEIDGGATSVTPQIAIAGVSGTVKVLDAHADELAVDLEGGFSDQSDADDPSPDAAGRLWSIAGDLRRDMTRGAVVVEMKSFELGKVPRVLAELPLVDSESATVGGRMELEFGDGLIHANGNLAVADLNVSHDLLAREIVRGLGFEAELAATIDPGRHAVDLTHLVVRRRGVVLRVEGSIVHPPAAEGRRYDLEFSVPPVPCQSVLSAIPVELIPALGGFELDGEFQAEITAKIDYSDLDALELGGSVGIGQCRTVSVPERMTAARLNSSFTHRVRMRDGRQRAVHLSPGSGSFTPIASISPNMIAAVQTTEDGGFWRHRGFLPSQFEEALRRNLKAGRVRLGASTISMQMVKNVFLSHERTLSRKLQELFLTWYVERTVSKDRIMELYLNVIEFGPGLYGITNAARHYFGRHPSELTSLEAIYLAMMLPSPVKRHAHYCRQALSPGFENRLRRNHGLMRSRGRISEEEYALWKDLELIFDPRELRGQDQCLGEIAALSNAKGTQMALSGLLASTAVATYDRPGLDPESPPEEDDAEVPLPDVDPGPEARDWEPPVDDDPAMSDAPGVPAMDPEAPPP